MQNGLLMLTAVLMAIINPFGACSHAALRQCDFSDPPDGDADGGDLSQFIANYNAGNSAADVNGDGSVNSADVDHFTCFFGGGRANILLIIADNVGVDLLPVD